MYSFLIGISILLILIILGVRIGIALGLTGFLYLFFVTQVSPNIIVSGFFDGMDSFALMAAPLFILAGNIMNRTGLIKGLFALGGTTLGWLPAGTGAAAMFACIFFAAITGSSVAEAAAMSKIAIPVMQEKKYDDAFAAGLVCTGGTLGLLIPPSLTFIIYGVSSGTSISKLFMAGVVPGIILGTCFIILVAFIGWRKKYPREKITGQTMLISLKNGIWAMLMPVIIIGGIYGGLFTPTEAAAVSCGYALIYGLIKGGRTQFIRELPDILWDTVLLTAVLLLLLGGANIFAKALTMEQVPQLLTQSIVGENVNPYVILIGINILYLIMGCFMDGLSLILITVPVIVPLAIAAGIDPVHLGVVLTINIELGVITPPVGLNLYTVSAVSGISIGKVIKGSLPFMLVALGVLILCTYVPQISLWLPTLMAGK